MAAESRTAKSLKNSVVALGFYFVNLILQFFSRKIFLDYLGAEVLGLNTTATNLLQFLNLAEPGESAPPSPARSTSRCSTGIRLRSTRSYRYKVGCTAASPGW